MEFLWNSTKSGQCSLEAVGRTMIKRSRNMCNYSGFSCIKQLRNLVWATSKHDVYLMSYNSVVHWSALTSKKSVVLNMARHVAPSEYVDREGISYCFRTTHDDNAIINAVEIYETGSGAVHFLASNNDCGIRDFDMEKFQVSKHFRFPWPVNKCPKQPGGHELMWLRSHALHERDHSGLGKGFCEQVVDQESQGVLQQDGA